MLISDNYRYFSLAILVFAIFVILPITTNAETLKVIIKDQDGSAISSAKVMIGEKKKQQMKKVQ